MLADYKPKIIAIGKDSEIINYLKTIFNYYTYNYNLTVVLDLGEYGQYFQSAFNRIYIITSDCAFNYAKSSYMKFKIQSSNIKEEYLIETLLHELKHAIDWQYDREEMINEREKVDYDKYDTDINYHDSIPLEKRANEFASKEKDKWIGEWHKKVEV